MVGRDSVKGRVSVGKAAPHTPRPQPPVPGKRICSSPIHLRHPRKVWEAFILNLDFQASSEMLILLDVLGRDQEKKQVTGLGGAGL